MLATRSASTVPTAAPTPVSGGRARAGAAFDLFDGEVGVGRDLLDLHGLRTVRFKKTPLDILVEAEMTLPPPSHCPSCGGFLFIRNGAPSHVVKDLPLLGRRTRVCFKWQRYLCQLCRHTWQPPLPGVDTRSGMTERLVAYVGREAMKMQPFAAVADATGVGEQTVRNIFTELGRHLEQTSGPAREFPIRVAVDECYVDGVARFVVTDLDHRRTFEMLPKKDMLTVSRFLIQLPHPERVEVVAMDMCRPYRDLVRRFLPKAKIVVDKFHILRMANVAVMTVRRGIREGLPDARRAECMPNRSPLKGKGKRCRFLLLKRAYRLGDREKETLKEWKEEYPEIKAAHEFKEEFYNIWNALDRRSAERHYDDWARRVRRQQPVVAEAFQPLLRAVSNWREEVFNYFDHRVTNGQAEARNNVIKSMQRQGRGYDFETVRTRMLYREEVLAAGATQPPVIEEKKTTQSRGSKPKRRKPDRHSPRSNAGKLVRARRDNDVFTELMRPPQGFVDRFKDFGQLDLLWDLPWQD
jgi:transposase